MWSVGLADFRMTRRTQEPSRFCSNGRYPVHSRTYESRTIHGHAHGTSKSSSGGSNMQAYDTLWDDISKQFLQHTESAVLAAAIQAINHLCSNTSMSTANATKQAELEDALFSSLRNVVEDEDISTANLNEDQIAELEATLLRITLLQRSRDLVEVMEDQEGGQTSIWDIVCSVAERGSLGYKEESKVGLLPNATNPRWSRMPFRSCFST
jgi:hypothetical protein